VVNSSHKKISLFFFVAEKKNLMFPYSRREKIIQIMMVSSSILLIHWDIPKLISHHMTINRGKMTR
jgi:hypothetical protein